MKTVIITSGWQQSADDARYDYVAEAYVAKGFRVVRHSPVWDARPVTDWARDLQEMAQDHSDDGVALWGFSLGGMMSLLVASQVRCESIVLGSPSGFFREYMPLIDPEYLVGWSPEQLEAYRTLSLADTIGKIKTAKKFVIAGELELAEWPSYRQEISDLKAARYDVRLAAGAHHDCSTPSYVEAVQAFIANL